MDSFKNFFRNFFAGLAILIPLIITIGIVVWMFEFLNNFIGLQSWLGGTLRNIDFIPYVSEWLVVAIGYLIVIIVIALVGRGAAKVGEEREIAKRISEFFEKIPLINRVYKGVEQLWDFLFHRRTQNIARFGAVVVFRYANNLSFGLLASNKKFLLDGKEHLFVFMASSPIPATGFNYWVPVEDVYYCNITLEQFAKVHLSLGVLSSEIYPSDLGLRKFEDGPIFKKKPSPKKIARLFGRV